MQLTCDYKSETSSDMSRLCEATFSYENMSVLIRKKTTSKRGERLYLGVQQRFVKTIKTTVVNENYGRNYSSLNNGFKCHARRG